jgi:hypothetical protein
VTGDVTGDIKADDAAAIITSGATLADSSIGDGVTATTQSADDNSTKIATTAYVDNATTSVAVLTGTIASGGTIPLPSGYVQSECKWTVGVGSFTSTATISAHSSYCTVNSSRVVSMLFHGVSTSNIANYIIIGIK